MEVSVDQEVVVVARGSSRTKKPKKFKKYKKEDLEKALMMIQSNKISRLAASKIYKVPLMTLEKKLQDQFPMACGTKKITKSPENEVAAPSNLISSQGSNSLIRQPKNPTNQLVRLPDVPYWCGSNSPITQFNPVSTMDIENNDNSDELMNNSINFGIFPIDNSVNFTPTPYTDNESKFAKLAAKIRLDVKELGDLCAPNENEKLNVVKAINQQLTLFNPPEVQFNCDSHDNIDEHNTIHSILKRPGMPQRLKPKQNLNVSFALVNSVKVINEVEELEYDPKKDKIAKNGRKRKILEIAAELREARKMLNILRTEHSSKIKEVSQKKKLKIHTNDGVDLGLQEQKKKIKEKVDQIRQLRELLKSLKMDHVAADKAVAIKRRNVLMKKRKKD